MRCRRRSTRRPTMTKSAASWSAPMSNRTNGSVVRELEREFAKYVGAQYGIACCNGTATLHTALVALGVKLGDWVAVPPLTMASTTLAVLHAGAVPHYWDVSDGTWEMWPSEPWVREGTPNRDRHWEIPVALYGLKCGYN